MAKPECFEHFMENMGNPNCPICHLAAKCYEGWNQKDKIKEALRAEQMKPWNKQRPLSEIFPELACKRGGGGDCG